MSERQRWTLLAVSIAAFMLLLDLTIVIIALTDIQQSLDSSFDDLQWVVDAYALTLAAFLLTAGALADRIGRRKVFLIGLVIFGLASLGCGLAWSSPALVIFRALQGVGGAVLLAAGPALIAQEFEVGVARNKAFAAFGGASGLALAAGPLIGGALTTIGWRWIFLINLPIGLLCLAVALVKLRDAREDERRAIDWAGAVLLCAGLFLGTYALMRGQAEGWTSAKILTSLIAAVVLLAVFVWRQSTARAPLMDLSLFRNITFSGLSIATLLAFAAIFPAIFFSTLYLQQVLGHDALASGIRMLPLTGALFVASALAAPLAAKVSPRLLLTLGLALAGVGLFLLRGLSPDDTWDAMLPGFIVCGLGVGVFNVVRAETTVSLVPPSRSGEASGVGSTFQEVGVALGIAVLGALFQHRMTSAAGDAPSSVTSDTSLLSPEGAEGPQAAVATVVRRTFVDAMDEIFLVAGITALAGAVLVLLMVRRTDAVEHEGEDRSAKLPAAS
ncbi:MULTISPECIES: MFS transporter [unclassified Streptomyces]|uniref:MFS transporter n=1 Tax=unclassified Streptomyces TaxID=2593676 RepID=UPI002238D37A|nr:MFS transporter [Streptomyces sp. SHP 1-2]MCW5249031.1 MFS transporter [Streptomyces sp. SHP 1-2]